MEFYYYFSSLSSLNAHNSTLIVCVRAVSIQGYCRTRNTLSTMAIAMGWLGERLWKLLGSMWLFYIIAQMEDLSVLCYWQLCLFRKEMQRRATTSHNSSHSKLLKSKPGFSFRAAKRIMTLDWNPLAKNSLFSCPQENLLNLSTQNPKQNDQGNQLKVQRREERGDDLNFSPVAWPFQ